MVVRQRAGGVTGRHTGGRFCSRNGTPITVPRPNQPEEKPDIPDRSPKARPGTESRLCGLVSNLNSEQAHEVCQPPECTQLRLARISAKRSQC